MIKLIIPGDPQGKARARVTRWGSYTPEKTANYEGYVKMIAKQATKEYFMDEPLRIRVVAYYEIPKSTSKKKQALMLSNQIRPTKKPDADNVLKLICDSLNGICYKDDAQIVSASIEKLYSDEPRVEVEVSKI